MGFEIPQAELLRAEARFWSKAERGGAADCWPWQAYRNEKGYGRFMCAGKARAAHRVAYQLCVGTIPSGMQLDHLCRNRGCINPNHLEAVSPIENTRRGLSAALTRQRWIDRNCCRHGHEYTTENTLPPGWGYKCRTCFHTNRANRRARGGVR